MYRLCFVLQRLRSVTVCKVTRVLLYINVQITFQTVIDIISQRISGSCICRKVSFIESTFFCQLSAWIYPSGEKPARNFFHLYFF